MTLFHHGLTGFAERVVFSAALRSLVWRSGPWVAIALVVVVPVVLLTVHGRRNRGRL